MKTQLPLKRLISFFALMLIITNLKAQFNGNYSIGSTSQFTTITSAVDSLMKVGVSGPTTFVIDSGTYVEFLTFYEFPGASEANRVTFKAKNDSVNDVKIIETMPGIVSFYGADFITLQSLCIENSYFNCVKLSNGSNHITLNNCILKKEPVNINNRMYDVVYGANTSNDSYTTITNCKMYNGSCGVYLEANTNNQDEKGHIIENNEFFGSYVHNFGIVGVDSARVVGNTIKSSTNNVYKNACGIIINASPNALVEKNKVFVNKHGIRIHNISNANDSTMVFNNMVTTKYSSNAFSAFPLYISGGNKNLKVYNNNFYNVYNASVGAVFAENHNGDVNISFINNNFICKGYYIAQFNNSPTKYTIEYNNFNNVGGSSNFWIEGVWYESIKAAADLIGKNNTSINPMYSGNDDLHVNNSLLGNLGTPLAEIVDDIDGDLRDFNNPDIGADEFNPSLGIDLAFLNAGFNEAPLCQAPEKVNCSIKNIGYKTVTKFAIVRSVNYTVKDTTFWTGNLNSYESLDLTLSYSDFSNGDTLELSVINVNDTVDDNTLNNHYSIDGVWLAQTEDLIVADSVEGYLTITEAIDILETRGVCSDVNIILKPGVYNNIIELYEIAGASENAKITIQSETGNPNDVIIAPLSCDNAVIEINGTDYLTIKNVTVKADSLNCEGILFVGGATHNTYENLTIYADVKGNQNGIYSSNSDDHNLTIKGCSIYNGNYGIEIKGVKGEDQIVIENNIFTGKIQSAAIYCDYPKNIIIKGNKVVIDSSYSAAGFEIYNVYGRVELVNNEIYIDSTNEAGLDIEYFYGPGAQKSLIANNVVSVGGKPWAGMFIYEVTNTNIYNNTFISSSNTSSGYTVQIDYGCSVDFRNNNVVAMGNATAVYFYDSPIGINYCNHNNLYTTGSYLIRYGKSWLENLSDWQNYGWDLNSVSVNPEFYNGYKTCNTALNNVGSKSNEVPAYDINGKKRNTETPDLGAYEFEFFTPGLLGSDFMLCEGSVELSAGEGGETYVWNTGEQTSSILVNKPGTYYVAVTGMCGTSGTDSVTVLSPEIKADFDLFISENTIALQNKSTGIIDNYLWTIGDYESTMKNEVYTFTTSGTYEVMLEVSNTCNKSIADTTLTIEVTGISDFDNVQLKVYPNPVSTSFKIEYGGSESVQLTLFDIHGTIHYFDDKYFTGNEIDVNKLPSGMYFVKLYNAEIGAVIRKLSIKP